MRIGVASLVALALCALCAAPASAGSKVAACDAVAAPGGNLSTTVELTNNGDRPARFKVTVQVSGDRENVAGPLGRIRGKKAKQTFTVGAGQRLSPDIACRVPSDALGPMVVSVTVKGPDGRERFEAGTWAFPNGEMPDPSDPPDEWKEPEVLELTGTIHLDEDFFPWTYGKGAPDGVDQGPMPGDAWMPPPFEAELRLVTEEGDEWQLLGPEAWVLAALMWKADVFEAEATVSGFPLEAIPLFYGEENGLTRKLRGPGNGGPPVAFPDALFLLEWEVEGIEDPRPKLVEFRWLLDGDRSRIEEYKEYVVRDEDGWETLLADAGIILPDPPEDPATRGFVKQGLGTDDPVNGGFLPPDEMPPWYRDPWAVDFEKETVLGLFVGEKPTSGYMVFIDRIVREDDGLHVQYCVTEPDPYWFVLDVLTYPFTIVAIPKTDEEVVFEEVEAPTWYYDQPSVGPMPGMR